MGAYLSTVYSILLLFSVAVPLAGALWKDVQSYAASPECVTVDLIFASEMRMICSFQEVLVYIFFITLLICSLVIHVFSCDDIFGSSA